MLINYGFKNKFLWNVDVFLIFTEWIQGLWIKFLFNGSISCYASFSIQNSILIAYAWNLVCV
jgi:hypothetical protein